MPKEKKNNSDNLKPIRSVDEARELGKKGGKASGESRRKKKLFREAFDELLSMPLTNEKMIKNLTSLDVKVTRQTKVKMAVAAAMVKEAYSGNVKAFLAIRDTIGENQVDKLSSTEADDLSPVAIPADLMCAAYVDLNRRITNGEIREAIIKGGRGGWKSTYPGLKIPELIMANPQVHGLAVRNVKDTLKDSVYAQIKWGIEMLGVSDRFKCTVSPLAITYLPTGQQIYFRGADDPLKIKSIKPPFGYIGILWFEEFDQYSGEAAIRNIKQSALRGTDSNGESSAIIFETFNPPKTAQAWANRYTADIEARQNTDNAKQGTQVLHTTYKDLPPEWLGDEFLFEAEELKKNNPTAYDNEYLGIVTGTGGNVFENLEIRTITDAEIATFGQYKQGLDWGYFPDPTAFVRGYYNPATMTIYLFDERKYVKTGNETLVNNLAAYKKTQTTADNAEEKSIAYFKENGFNIRACVKGAGSVEFGIKWLASRAKIVIDRARCPEAAGEFETYEYLKDKDGNYISGYPDENNHFIDATRYMFNDEIMRSKHYKTYGGISKV